MFCTQPSVPLHSGVDWQQVWLAPPQAWQVEFVQLLPLSHIEPPQQGCVSRPHALHMLEMQTAPGPQLWPVQHDCPGEPQLPQRLPMHCRLLLQVVPLQQGSPMSPHTQTPARHAPVDPPVAPVQVVPSVTLRCVQPPPVHKSSVQSLLSDTHIVRDCDNPSDAHTTSRPCASQELSLGVHRLHCPALMLQPKSQGSLSVRVPSLEQ
jgi:hypothetical protein